MARASFPHLMHKLWVDYVALNPDADKIHALLSPNAQVENDHIALRTLDHPKINIYVLASFFEKYGFVEQDTYTFPEKKLKAKYYQHPTEPSWPKIFISQLILDQLPKALQTLLTDKVTQIPANKLKTERLLYAGRLWSCSYDEYLALANVSEYAAWWAALGFHANHFTVLVNSLKTKEGDEINIEQVNQSLKLVGYQLNNYGGEIKGSKQDLLLQSATLAYQKKMPFNDGMYSIPTCYYEFAQRFANEDGEQFDGFVPSSADKIFQSTDRNQ
ncbi:DUF1338 domain-containing protein [Catenovulum agarivorans]|nr:DUF1338 domain-containing protein [Catenovulum agarivorans]